MSSRWQTLPMGCRSIVMWGAADQGRVNYHILSALGYDVVLFVDDTPELISPVPAVPLFKGIQQFETWLRGQDVSRLGFVIAIGNPYGHIRMKLHHELEGRGLSPMSFADPSALICGSAIVGEGLQAMACAIVHNEAVVGTQCIVNTRALVEHDCVLGDGVEIGPAATLCGRVHVGANSWIGAGATVLPRLRVGENAIVGAGAVVVQNVPDGAIAVGNPAHVLPRKITPSAKFHGMTT